MNRLSEKVAREGRVRFSSAMTAHHKYSSIVWLLCVTAVFIFFFASSLARGRTGLSWIFPVLLWVVFVLMARLTIPMATVDVGPEGFWIRARGKESYVPFEDVAEIAQVRPVRYGPCGFLLRVRLKRSAAFGSTFSILPYADFHRNFWEDHPAFYELSDHIRRARGE